MDSLLCVVIMTSLALSSALDASKGVLMQVYEDDMTVQNHWEAILHCALTYPGLVRENCSRMWWSHEIDRETHAEEDPEEEKDLYRINTELIKHTSHLEILAFNERVMGPYKCQARCGDHLYAVLCEVRHFPSKNRSILCSEKLFKRDPPASEPVDEERHSTLLLTLTVVLGILAAVVTSGVLKWLNKRRAVRKRYRQAMEEIARHSASRPNSHHQRARPRPQPPRREAPARNVSLPRNQSNLFFNTIAHTDEVVYQQLPDGSQIVFIPANKLPSYEDSVAAAAQGIAQGDHGRTLTHAHEDRNTSGGIHGHSQAPDGHFAARSDSGHGRMDGGERLHGDLEEHPERESSDLSDTSLPPSYKSETNLSERDSLLRASCSGSTSSLNRENSPNGLHHESHMSTSQGGSQHQPTQPSQPPQPPQQPQQPQPLSQPHQSSEPSQLNQPLLFGQQERSRRVPRWILGYPPPAYHE